MRGVGNRHAARGRRWFVAVACVVSACGTTRERRQNTDVAALRLSCEPAAVGIRCRALAVFSDVRQSARDVTADATWRLVGTSARITRDGTITASGNDGPIEIGVEYRGRRERMHAMLSRSGPGRLLATLHGHVYTESGGRLRPVDHVYVQIVDAGHVTRSAMTNADGVFSIEAIEPGDVIVHAAATGFDAAHEATHVGAGDNRFNLLLEPTTTARTSA